MAEIKRTRTRRGSLRIDLDDIKIRVEDFYKQDMEDRDFDIEARLQRYAKYRMWTEGAGGPWEGSSDIAMPDMQEKSFRVQDTLHNAVMSNRPAINARALNRINDTKQRHVDNLLDYQFFEEARGETVVGDMAEAFLNDAVLTVFVPWVEETRKQSGVLIFPGIPDDTEPSQYFRSVITGQVGADAVITPIGDVEQPWDFEVKRPGIGNPGLSRVTYRFYTRADGRVEAVIRGEVSVFNGPMPRVLDYDDVFHPARAENLQPPGPSNPNGSSHVIIRDFPDIDEIRRLRRKGFYDLLTKEDADRLEGFTRQFGGSDDREETQRDDLAGKSASEVSNRSARSHNQLTRLVCFDRIDIDNDGFDEDVMIWYLVEPAVVIRVATLQEMYPSLNPRRPRPFAEGSLFPVRGRRVGISLLEQIESLHDASKTILDQGIDANTLAVIPFGFYRPGSNMHSEPLRVSPGELYPLAEPQRDVFYPQIGNPQAMAMSINLSTMMDQWKDRLTTVGSLQLGGVPAGKSSALRTSQNMQAVMMQGEARPQRIVRRFFNVLAEVYAIMHELNQFFLPKRKQIRLMGPVKPNEDPYIDELDKDLVTGHYQFKFQANAMNTSAAQLQASLDDLFATYASALFVQLGLVTPENLYNMARDRALAQGIDPAERGYLSPPSPESHLPRILAEEAVLYILESHQFPPMSRPAEVGGWAEHMQKFVNILQTMATDSVDTSQFTEGQADMMAQYASMCAQKAQEEAYKAQMAANAAALAQGGGGAPGPGAPPQGPPQALGGPPQLSGPTEMIDESLPSAGGGANAGA